MGRGLTQMSPVAASPWAPRSGAPLPLQEDGCSQEAQLVTQTRGLSLGAARGVSGTSLKPSPCCK
jgi:hypothetical protein